LSEWEALEIMQAEPPPRAPSPPSRAVPRPRPQTPQQVQRAIERCFPITAERGPRRG
jgi:hypothetical protein